MSPVVVEELSLIERKEYALRDAVATGDNRRIDKAAKALERARDEAAKQATRAKDKAHAQAAVNAQRIAREAVEHKAKADAAEAVLRETGLPYAVVHTGTGQ